MALSYLICLHTVCESAGGERREIDGKTSTKVEQGEGWSRPTRLRLIMSAVKTCGDFMLMGHIVSTEWANSQCPWGSQALSMRPAAGRKKQHCFL